MEGCRLPGVAMAHRPRAVGHHPRATGEHRVPQKVITTQRMRTTHFPNTCESLVNTSKIKVSGRLQTSRSANAISSGARNSRARSPRDLILNPLSQIWTPDRGSNIHGSEFHGIHCLQGEFPKLSFSCRATWRAQLTCSFPFRAT